MVKKIEILNRLLYGFSAVILLTTTQSFGQNYDTVDPYGYSLSDWPSTQITSSVEAYVAPDVWEPIGPMGVSAVSLAVSELDPDLIYLGGIAGLYKTTDGGTHWQIAGIQSLNHRVNSIALNPFNNQIVYAWFRKNLMDSASYHLMKTTDGGTTWTVLLNRPGSNISVNSQVILDTQNPLNIYATCDSIFKTTDGGNSWTTVGNFSNINAFAVYPQDFDILYANASKPQFKYYASTDGGNNWASYTASISLNALQFSVNDPSVLYAGNGSVLNGRFMRSISGGISWIPDTASLGRSKSVRFIALDPIHPNRMYIGGSASCLKLSNDSGLTWISINGTVNDNYPSCMQVMTNGTLYCAFGSTFCRSTNLGNTWQSLDGDLTNQDVFRVIVHPTYSNKIYAGTLGGLYYTDNGGITWQQKNNGLYDNDVFELKMDPLNSDILYAGTFGGLFYKTTDGGDNWVEKSNGLPVFGQRSIDRILVHPYDPSLLWAGNSTSSFHSTDGGENWSNFKINGFMVNNIICDPSHPDTLYAMAGSDTLFRSENRGLDWEVRSTGLSFTHICVDPGNSDILFAATASFIYQSTDKGLTWNNRYNSNIMIRDLTVHPIRPSHIYTSSFYAGLIRSTDGGMMWQTYNNGLKYLSLFQMTLASDYSNLLFAATYGGSVFRLSEAEVSVDNIISKYNGFELLQNFPNPFNPSTIIRYRLSGNSNVELKIFNLLGQVVRTLIQENQNAGFRHVQWDGKNQSGIPVSSGLYICRLTVENEAKTMKILLMK